MLESLGKIQVFEGRRVGLGAQSRAQEAPKEDKKRHRKKKKEKQRQEEHQERQKERFCPRTQKEPPLLTSGRERSGAVGSGRRKGRGACGGIKGGLHNNIKQYVTI